MKILKNSLKVIGMLICVLIGLVIILAIYNQVALKQEADKIIPNGQMIDLGDYSVHVYSEGENNSAPTMVFLAGSATVAPVYDFKPLSRLLSDDYSIAVVEKAGYGYSDISSSSRDVETMVNEVRNALAGANMNAPYVLLPHSMSGLEAIYWEKQYPDEISGIVGLDMAVPHFYDDFDFSKIKTMTTLGSLSVKLGLLRVPGIYPLNQEALSEEEITQQKLLMYRNAVNEVYINEGSAVYDNAQIAKEGGKASCPVLMFSSDGTEIGGFWVDTQEQYAEENDAELIVFDCGHYLHYYKSKEMAGKIKTFMNDVV